VQRALLERKVNLFHAALLENRVSFGKVLLHLIFLGGGQLLEGADFLEQLLVFFLEPLELSGKILELLLASLSLGLDFAALLNRLVDRLRLLLLFLAQIL